MGFEIPLDADYFDHPKVIGLVARIGKRADVFPLRLFAWCAKFCKKGKTEGPEQIELACRWDGKPGVLHAALVSCGIVDKDGKTVHDWMEYGGRKLASYERKKAAQRRAYKDDGCRNSAGILPEENGILPANKDDSSENSANLVNETKRNETKQHDTETKLTVSLLADRAAFDQGYACQSGMISKWHTVIQDLQNNDFSLKQIEFELGRKPLKSEPPWEFLKRLLPNQKAQSTGNNRQLSTEEFTKIARGAANHD